MSLAPTSLRHILCFFILAIVGDTSIGTIITMPILHSVIVPLCVYPEAGVLDLMVLIFSVLFFFEKLPCHFP